MSGSEEFEQEADAVPGSQGEVAVGDVDQFQRRPTDQVPPARPGLGVDPRLPTRQSDGPGFHPQPRRRQPRDVAQLRYSINNDPHLSKEERRNKLIDAGVFEDAFNTSLAEHNRAVNRYQRSRHGRLSTG